MWGHFWSIFEKIIFNIFGSWVGTHSARLQGGIGVLTYSHLRCHLLDLGLKLSPPPPYTPGSPPLPPRYLENVAGQRPPPLNPKARALVLSPSPGPGPWGTGSGGVQVDISQGCEEIQAGDNINYLLSSGYKVISGEVGALLFDYGMDLHSRGLYRRSPRLQAALLLICVR